METNSVFGCLQHISDLISFEQMLLSQNELRHSGKVDLHVNPLLSTLYARSLLPFSIPFLCWNQNRAISSFTRRKWRRKTEIGYALVPSERNEGYGTEAIQLMADYLFLSKDIVRIQAPTESRNMASQRVLEKAGFSRDGVMRKSECISGEYRNMYLYCILREEWEPKMLTAERT